MHYRDGKRGPRRLEHLEELTKHYAPAMIRRYDTDRITILPDMEPQVAVLQFQGPQEPERVGAERKRSLLSRAAAKLPLFRQK